MSKSCRDGHDGGDFVVLPGETADSTDKSEINNNAVKWLIIQLEEMEMLQSIFPNPGEFIIADESIIEEILQYIAGDSFELPPNLDFTINLVVGEMKLEICVNLPSGYPVEKPDLFTRSDSLTREQQHKLNIDLDKYVGSICNGEVSIYAAVAWLQEKGDSYIVPVGKVKKSNKEKPRPTVLKKKDLKFNRYWVYCHHIYNKLKRRSIQDLSEEFSMTGFCLPGKPGIICVEGWEADCSDWWQKVRVMNWKKIVCKQVEEEKVGEDGSIECFRKFTGFQEIICDTNKNKSSYAHMDMGEFYKFLSDHNCSYMFKEFFGLEGRSSEAAE